MSFYLRKSIRVGPIRFNLSKSGIGISAGIGGFRVGSGPRGNYVHMGRSGIYYRKTLASSRGASAGPASPRSDPARIPSAGFQSDVGPMREIESGEVTAMTDSSSVDLLKELDEKQGKARIGRPIFILGVFCVGAASLLRSISRS